jgi:hypothetical protein
VLLLALVGGFGKLIQDWWGVNAQHPQALSALEKLLRWCTQAAAEVAKSTARLMSRCGDDGMVDVTVEYRHDGSRCFVSETYSASRRTEVRCSMQHYDLLKQRYDPREN